ncbi:hypothetical protein [Rhodococcus sp. 11-3]|uniref:hypothetical protein n=1 Tax=Rhodococcus sp. 11-3 TaxID=2854796 RepID=UPI00203BF977|nr:hypothetical protein [Rhodococcus sp. 11-3]USC16994.1 hypothetical protein KZJ41_09070 [Rhodococcus sp. 11-3]
MAYIRERYGPIGTEPGHGLWQDIPSTWPKPEPKLHQRIWRRLVDFLDYAWMYVMVAVTPDEVDR